MRALRYAVCAFLVLGTVAVPARAAQDDQAKKPEALPTWKTKEEPAYKWEQVAFVDESGVEQTLAYNIAHLENKDKAPAKLFELRETGVEQKTVTFGIGNYQTATYGSELSPYAVVREDKKLKVVRPGDATFKVEAKSVRHTPIGGDAGSKYDPKYTKHREADRMVVMPPTKRAEDKAAARLEAKRKEEEAKTALDQLKKAEKSPSDAEKAFDKSKTTDSTTVYAGGKGGKKENPVAEEEKDKKPEKKPASEPPTPTAVTLGHGENKPAAEEKGFDMKIIPKALLSAGAGAAVFGAVGWVIGVAAAASGGPVGLAIGAVIGALLMLFF